uniref:Uncharacterized protein n=1 Tax=viral metagenome TaxID=1070528 RepID=A0A6C0K0L1_9ZZZZ
MYDIISKTGLLSLRNLMTYRIIGTTVTEKIGEHVLDMDFIMQLINNRHNLQCLSCITYDILSTSILIYVLSYHFSGEPTTIKKLEKVENLAKLRKLVGKTLWVILFVLTKNVENAT